MRTQFRPAVLLTLWLTLLTGVLYPLAVTGIAGIAFSHQARGSWIQRQGQTIGSALMGQEFTSARYFWGRPSATPGRPYAASSSSGSNLGPTNPALRAQAAARLAALRVADPGNTQPVPVDLVTASGSGLDPHISPAGAAYQVARVARARGLPEGRVTALVADHVERRTLGVLGEPRVNVLQLNLALDALR